MSNNPLLPPAGHRRNSRRLHPQGHTQQMETSVAAANQNPGSLASVELNSTLALKAQLQCVQREYFNKENAVLESLRRSERTKNLINTKASEVVNVARSQLLYNSLVSVDVQEEQLISAVLQDRLLVALPPSHCSGLEAEEAPSHLLFTPSLLIRQKPLPSEDKPVVTQGPSTHRLRCFFPRKTAVE